MSSGILGFPSFLRFLNYSRGNQQGWRTILFVLALLPLIVWLMGLSTLLNTPYLGMEFQSKNDKWYIVSVAPHSPAAEYPELNGKELIAIGDWNVGPGDLNKELDAIKTWGELQHIWADQTGLSKRIEKGLPLRITIKDSSQVKSFTLRPAYLPVMTILFKNLSPVIISAIYLLIGLIILAKRAVDQITISFYLTCILASINAITLQLTSSREVAMNGTALQGFYFVQVFAAIFATTALLHFFLVFPKDTFGLNKNKFGPLLPYLFATIMLIMYWPRLFYGTYQIFISGAIILGLYVLIKNYLRMNSLEKAQMKWVYYGAGLFIFCTLIFSSLPYLFVGQGLISQNQVLMLSTLLPLTIAFAITKYRLMDIDAIFDNTLIYSITLGLLALIDFGVISALTDFKIISFSVSQPFSILIGVWVIIFAYVPVRNRVQAFIKHLLKREVYDLNETSLGFGRDLLSAATVSQVLEKMTDTIDRTLHPKGIEAQLSKEKTESLAPLGGVLIPVVGTAGPVGTLILQEKHSQRLYDKNDMKLLNTLAGQAAIAIEAIRYREAVQRKEHEACEEKERISREIHDGIGSSFTKAILITDAITQKSKEEEKEYCQELKKTLSEGISELRTLVWTVDERESTLQDLVLQISENLRSLKDKGDVQYHFHRKVIDDDRIAPPMLRRNILRIVNESLTNIIKHADATVVDISMIYDGTLLLLKIRDNGKGCPADREKNMGHGLRNMKKRCEEVGGRFTLTAAPQQGTEILLEVNF